MPLSTCGRSRLSPVDRAGQSQQPADQPVLQPSLSSGTLYRHQFGLTSQRTRPALAEHRYIVDVIAAHDAEMAELMMRRHVRASRENLERMLATTPS